MDYTVEMRVVDAGPLAAVLGRANAGNIAQQIPALLNPVWEFIRASNLGHTGINVVLYRPEPGDTFDSAAGFPIECGVQVTQEFEAPLPVQPRETPAGLVATTAHLGPYNQLGAAHSAVRAWCAANGHALAGPSWEVYGHWTDNPAELRTDVFYLMDG